MPRPLRIEFENAWYHVMNRGAGRQNIFNCNNDRLLFLEVLQEATTLFKIEIHAYCLMDNHYHLQIKTLHPNLGRAMRHIDGVYTQRYNRSHQTDGPLFRGRYKAIIIDKDNYLLQVNRYIHLNPIIAKIVCDLQDYNWSSYLGYIDATKKLSWLFTEEILTSMNCKDPITSYKNFTQAGVDFELNQFYKKSNIPSILGDADFKKELLETLDLKRIEASLTDYKRTRELPTTELIIQACTDYFDLNLKDLFGFNRTKHQLRDIKIYLCRTIAMDKLSNIANRFQLKSANTISDIVKTIERSIKTDRELEKLICTLENIIRIKS